MEFQTNTGDCFMSNEQFASNFGVSASTIKRAIDNLEIKGFIARDTKNIKGGRIRHMTINFKKIEEKLQVSK